MAEELRQGEGIVRVIKGTPPTDRADGTPLDPSEISHYNWYISYNGGDPVLAGVTQLVNGEFTESFNVDDQEAGAYVFYYTTVDTQVPPKESEMSNGLEILVLVPFLAAPNPPTSIS